MPFYTLVDGNYYVIYRYAPPCTTVVCCRDNCIYALHDVVGISSSSLRRRTQDFAVRRKIGEDIGDELL
jgi:hypothetical protein